ncbi:hypothetical protein AGLY_004306 [Aphis glycines]|uniref:Uncharacterized protein n=1 Tax=Aphis glycines TaxID=307491 RepID=A0A6G0TYL6_APHGL|nr:hypothetical protein AGLY_004306 [Aphis glycines]
MLEKKISWRNNCRKKIRVETNTGVARTRRGRSSSAQSPPTDPYNSHVAQEILFVKTQILCRLKYIDSINFFQHIKKCTEIISDNTCNMTNVKYITTSKNLPSTLYYFSVLSIVYLFSMVYIIKSIPFFQTEILIRLLICVVQYTAQKSLNIIYLIKMNIHCLIICSWSNLVHYFINININISLEFLE